MEVKNQIHRLKINQCLTIEQPEEPLHLVAKQETPREMVFVREQTIVPDQVSSSHPHHRSPVLRYFGGYLDQAALLFMISTMMDSWISGSRQSTSNPRMLIQKPNGRLSLPLLCRRRPPRFEVKHWGGPPKIRHLTGLSAPDKRASPMENSAKIFF